MQITQTLNSTEIGCKLCANYSNCAQINSLTTNCGQITQTTNCGLGLRVKGLGFRVYGLRIYGFKGLWFGDWGLWFKVYSLGV